MDETSGTAAGAGDGATDGDQADYRERLVPSFGIWTILIGFALSLGVILLPFGTSVGVIVFLVSIVALLTLGWSTGAVIQVRSGRLHAGRAEIDLGFVRAVEPLDADAMRVARGTGLDARAFLCLRGWVTTGVRVRIDDPADPTPYWLISTRHPEQLAGVLDPAGS